MWTLGLDPALTGSAVLLSPRQQPLVGWTWRPRQEKKVRVWEVAVVQPPHARTERVATLHQLALLIAAGCRRVTGQALFCTAYETPHIGKNIQSGLSVALTTGRLLGPLDDQGSVIPVAPHEWRKGLFPVTLSREALKAASLTELPRKLPRLQAILALTAEHLHLPLDQLDHVTDAAGIALYAATQAP